MDPQTIRPREAIKSKGGGTVPIPNHQPHATPKPVPWRMPPNLAIDMSVTWHMVFNLQNARVMRKHYLHAGHEGATPQSVLVFNVILPAA
jgi:hypothetical protein